MEMKMEATHQVYVYTGKRTNCSDIHVEPSFLSKRHVFHIWQMKIDIKMFIITPKSREARNEYIM